MEISERRAVRIESELTILATFLMGFIDAYTFTEQNHVFASAQTGNMVAFGVKLFTGQWGQVSANISVFIGFAIGAFVGAILLAKIPKHTFRNYRIFLYVQAAILLFLAIFQLRIDNLLIVFCLGLLSGYILTTFSKIRTTSVNNGIMTGNTKNLMSNLYLVLFEKDPVAKKDFMNLFIGILVFIAGVAIGTVIVLLNPIFNLWISFLLVVLFIFRLMFMNNE